MMKQLILVVFFFLIFSHHSNAQKKYGYAVLYLRCDKTDPQRNRVYYSPIIELNQLNFEKYTDGVDPSFPLYSVRYYNYAIAKWFEMYLNDKYHIAVNDPEKYEQNTASIIINEKNNGSCSEDKTSMECFFTDRQQLVIQSNKAIAESRSPANEGQICEVISL